MEILKVEHLVKKYGKGDSEVTAVNDVSFSVNQGEFVAIVGSSGSGKSTLLKLFMRFWDVNSGSIRIGSRDMYIYREKIYTALITTRWQYSEEDR